MRTRQYTLKAEDVQSHAQALLSEHLDLHDYSAVITAQRVYAVLLYAAALAATIAAACRRLRGAPCDQSVYNALDDTLPERLELQRRLNRALAGSLPRSIKKGQRLAKVAIDLVLQPYYGRPDPNDDMVYKGQEKASTHNHHAYATAYLVYKGRRFTLAMRAVRHDDPWDEIVRDLLRLARKNVPGIGLVLLDRGFYSVAVIRYLQKARYPFIMPLPCKGRKGDDEHPAGGSRPFFNWKKSGWSEHRLETNKARAEKEGRKDIRARVQVAVKVRRKVPPKRPGSKQGQPRVLVYACWGLKHRDVNRVEQAYQSGWTERVRQTYRERFGIETSYRQMNQGRAWTTSRNPSRRLLLAGLALLLRNVWALLHLVALCARGRRGGGPRLRLQLLPLQDMLGWIALALERHLGLRDRIEVEHSFTL